MDYLTALSLLHDALTPKSYVEIGCRQGRSLSLSRCPAIAIDPDFEIRCELRSATKLYRRTSDSFFANENLSELIGGAVDFAFVDGMHQSEFALRDILNIESHSSHDTIVVVDDILPQQMEWTTRERRTPAWTGDVYKVIPFLREYRQDLDIRVFDIDVKGLAIIANLNPADRSLQENLPKHEADLSGDVFAFSSIKELRSSLRPESIDSLREYIEVLRSHRSSSY
ncbi:class I SAM-dependent methyltransferase [Paracoccus sp. NGMCC 1.201697]|uniref:Class I SAM-dependent methyltransferase n=1 Tax=Paracoccus broussonetiae subsp. drimophilus TaxID=3373869 RepID=A0ABW7LRV7_9RHOB